MTGTILGPVRDPTRDTRPDSVSAGARDCLCLICRQVGHLVKSCPQFQSGHREHELPTQPETPLLPFHYPFYPNKASPQALCRRCIQLEGHFDVLAGINSSQRDKYMETVKRRMTPIPPLGPVTSVQLLTTCPLCCLIFDITYLSNDDLQVIHNPEQLDEGQLALVPAWTLVHLDSAQDLWPRKEWGQHSICLYTAVTRVRSCWKPQIGIGVHAGVDAIAVMDVEKNCAIGASVLGVKKVPLQMPDYRIVKEWFRRCDALHHITCQPLISEDLKKIKLVDTETRRIVSYPVDGCDYIALSYVWGGVSQPSHKLGDILPTIPATLEDAIVVTRHLGKRYLWADSLCIDQGDGSEKITQIPLMSAIYTGAWATIFNIAGRSAQSGLPRVGTLKDAIPQLSCEIGGKLLLSVMPPLSAQVSGSLWSTRAWTFQEGLLSSRRLFFTNHQVYFECNLVQCCESIDDSRSIFHLLSDEERETYFHDALHSPNVLVYSDPDEEFEGGVMRDPFRPIFTSKKQGISESFRIWKYEQLVHSYTSKKMTLDADALNAFSAVLARFQGTHYKRGFIRGLPVEDLPTALLWTHGDGVELRRRYEFPSWSWAGWKGVVTGACDSNVRGTTNKLRDVKKQFLPPLRVWKVGDDGHLELIYDFNPVQEDESNVGDEGGEEAVDREQGESTYPQSDGGYSSCEDSGSWDSDGERESVCTNRNEDGRDPDTVHRTCLSVILGAKANPVTALARTMLEETQLVPRIISRNELLVQGIVFRLTFMKLGPEHQDPDDCVEWCRIQVEDKWKDNCMILYGHDRAQLAAERQGKEQEFLLLRRTQFDSALLLVDREGEAAKRVGVASLVNVGGEDLWKVARPEIQLIKLI